MIFQVLLRREFHFLLFQYCSRMRVLGGLFLGREIQGRVLSMFLFLF